MSLGPHQALSLWLDAFPGNITHWLSHPEASALCSHLLQQVPMPYSLTHRVPGAHSPGGHRMHSCRCVLRVVMKPQPASFG